MGKLEQLNDKLTKIKDDIYSEEKSTEVDAVFKKLIKLNAIESELYETLILLYSNSKAEFDIVKTNHLKHSAKIIDTSVEMVTEINLLIIDIENLKDKLNKLEHKNKSIFTFKNLGLIIGGGVFIFLLLIILDYLAPQEVSHILNFITNMSNSKLAH